MNTETQLTKTSPVTKRSPATLWTYLPIGAYWAAAGLTTVTGVIQLYLYATTGAVFSLFAGAILFVAIAASLATVRRPTVYALGIPFLVGQLFAWMMQGMPYAQLGVVDKGLQVLLLVVLAGLLWIDHAKRNASTVTPVATQ